MAYQVLTDAFNFVKEFLEVFLDNILLCYLCCCFSLQKSGLSRELFEQWCTDRRNGVIIAGYCVEGTLAKVNS